MITKTSLFVALTLLLCTHSIIGQIQKINSSDFIQQLRAAEHSKFIDLKIGGKTVKIDFESIQVFNEKLSCNGIIRGAGFSNAMFKIDQDSVFGYVLFLEEGLGYSFLSNGKGQVEIRQTDPENYFHIMDFEKPKEKKLKVQTRRFGEIQQSEYKHVQSYVPGMNMHSLESKPGAENVIYLNWSAVFNGNTPKHLTSEEMYMVWAGTAAGYISFDVNVTTSQAVYNATPITNSCIANFKDFDARSHAPMDSWGTANGSTIYTANQTDWYVNKLVHEIGHQLGLGHDGAPHKEYFEGIDDYDWNSVMGNTWYANFLQYSKGEYKDANNFEDDFAMINRYIPYRKDDIATEKLITFSPNNETVDLEKNIGSIEVNTDEDVFTFSITEPKIVNLNIKPLEYRSMLDIDARIEDEQGNIIAQHNADLKRFAAFTELLLPTIGKYKLIIKGGAEGTPNWGFSNYSSVGVYGISGSIKSLSTTAANIVKMATFKEVCNEYAPTIELKNLGKSTINSIELEIISNNTTPSFLTINNLSIPSLSTQSLELEKIEEIGTNLPLKISVKKINGSAPPDPSIFETNYSLGNGIGIELYISNEAYQYTTWEIQDINGVKIKDPNSILAQEINSTEHIMRFCLAEDCYKLNIQHELESCSNIPKWSSNENYQAGATVTHESKNEDGYYNTYSNKWWASGSNVPGAGDPWEISGFCTGSDRGNYILKSIGSSSYLIEENSASNTTTQVHDFCPSVITYQEEVEIVGLKVYPNPVLNVINISLPNDQITKIQIFDISGRLIFSELGNQSNTQTFEPELPNGIFHIKIYGINQTQSALIKK